MAPTIAARFATASVSLVLVTFGVFVLVCALPGDPLDDSESGRILPPEHRAALRAQYHLDDPWPRRYLSWMRDVARGDLGMSLTYRRPVASVLRERLPTSLTLNSLALFVMVATALPLGILAAWRPGGRWDRSGAIATTALYAVPVFWMAVVLQWTFAVRLGWLPLFGVSTDGLESAPIWERWLDGARHIVLPIACLSYGGIAYVSRFVRSSLVESAAGEAGRAARARGLSTLRYVSSHGVAQAAVPLLTLVGFLIPRLVGGSLLVEQIFNIPGLGSLLIDSILARDLPVVLALTLLSGVATLAGTTLADALAAWADPRVSRGA